MKLDETLMMTKVRFYIGPLLVFANRQSFLQKLISSNEHLMDLEFCRCSIFAYWLNSSMIILAAVKWNAQTSSPVGMIWLGGKINPCVSLNSIAIE